MFTVSEWALKLAATMEPSCRFKGGDFQTWQTRAKQEFHTLLGATPAPYPLNSQVVKRIERKAYSMEKVVFYAEKFMQVPAWICVPKGVKKAPAVIVCHGHCAGKQNLVGIDDNAENPVRMDYQKQLSLKLASEGFITITPDWRSFGERHEPTEIQIGSRDTCNVAALSSEAFGYHLMTLHLWDAMKTIDYLETRNEVDIEKIFCVGCSFGGTMSLFLAATDKRIAAACVSGYLGRTVTHLCSGLCGSQLLPGIMNWGDRAEVGGLIAPRPLMIQSGEFDADFPTDEAVEEFERLKLIYKAAGQEDKLELNLFDGCHEIASQAIIQWLKKISIKAPPPV